MCLCQCQPPNLSFPCCSPRFLCFFSLPFLPSFELINPSSLLFPCASLKVVYSIYGLFLVPLRTFKLIKKKFFFFLLCWDFVAAHRLSLVAVCRIHFKAHLLIIPSFVESFPFFFLNQRGLYCTFVLYDGLHEYTILK